MINMDFTNLLKPTELSKIQDELSVQSSYQKDIINYTNLGYAQGFIQALKFMNKDEQEDVIKSLKRNSDKSDVFNYIFRLWEDI